MSIFGTGMSALGNFIADQIRERGISDREFSRLLGVSNATISRAMSQDAPEPSLDFLVKLSNGTGVSLMTLLKLSFPELRQVEVEPEARMLAEMIAQLPPDKREIAESFIVGTLMKSRNE